MVLAAGCACDGEPSESERVRQHLDRTPVHVALAVREALASRGDDEPTRAFLRLAEGSPHEAPAAADGFWERRERGRALLDGGGDRALGSVLGTGTEHAERDRLLYLLALVSVDAREARVPKIVMLYEALRLSPDRLDAGAQPFARALRASVLARASMCEGARQDAERALAVTEPNGLGAAVGAEPATVEPWAAAGTRLLANGALACCAVRFDDPSAAARAIESLLEDARTLGASDTTAALLETWAAASAGDAERAREALGRAERTERMNDEEWAKYQQLRDRLAAPEVQRTALVDRAWLSTTTARVLADAQDEADFFDGDDNPLASQVWALARALATVLSTARARQPTFDTASQEGSFWSRLGDLFG